jgi:hypothetical protein
VILFSRKFVDPDKNVDLGKEAKYRYLIIWNQIWLIDIATRHNGLCLGALEAIL